MPLWEIGIDQEFGFCVVGQDATGFLRAKLVPQAIKISFLRGSAIGLELVPQKVASTYPLRADKSHLAVEPLPIISAVSLALL